MSWNSWPRDTTLETMEFPPLVLYSQDPHNIDVALLSVKADGVEQTVPVKNDKQESVKNIYCHYQLQPKEGAICFRIQLFKKWKKTMHLFFTLDAIKD